MPSCSSSTRSSCSRSRRRGRRPGSLVALLALALLAPGCGDGTGADPRAAGPAPQPGGTLRIAVAADVATVDPLLASTRAERLVARQVYEPLVSRQNGPFGQTRQLPGVIRSLRPRRDATLWVARLRPGIEFCDGERLDADAVKANAARWSEVAPGPRLVPELDFVDSPRPEIVRFFLDRPRPGFARTLARAELGLVSPRAIVAADGDDIRRPQAGAGPFELRERDGATVVLARNASWWGTGLGLGPGVDRIEVLGDERTPLRVEQLESGLVQVADAVRPAAIAANPALTSVPGRGAVVAIERSVRGISTAAASQSLADVWLTDLR